MSNLDQVLPIIWTRILLVEGKDDTLFMQALLKHMDFVNQIEIREAGGKDNYPTALKLLVTADSFSQ